MPTIITLLGSCILRLIYMNIMMHRFTTFYQVVMIYPISWAITGATMIILYFAVTKKAYRTV
ncbi:MAG: hypothetical protein PUC40_09580 [Lachnospiraceae bacterium]|nr:hypothetical protein [Lachnospiraceae bacterium]MDD5957207.1 hypothetical protein [Lachnospiraceae bacterium]